MGLVHWAKRLLAVLVLACAASIQGSTPAQAFVLKRADSGATVRWEEGTVWMRVASGAACGPSPAEIASALEIAVEAWRIDLLVPDVVIEDGEPPPQYGYQPSFAGEGNGVYVLCDAWPFDETLAVTVATYAPDGRMLDADIVINGRQMLALLPEGGAPVNDHDLASVLTHEMGHVLGLDESDQPNATMWPTTAPGDTSQRTLSADDEQGVLAIYGDGAARLASYGCAVSRASSTRASSLFVWVLVLAGAWAWRRRR